ncbi:MAG TPA: hypothetical protein VMF04_00010 [Thermoplasmata archaeon]|nr:hypothetical protein [Thermoplasmata archaeon]
MLFAGAALVWILTYLDPLAARQRHRRARRLNFKVGHSGLRGRYDYTRPGDTGGPGTYVPADEHDQALFVSLRSYLESESAFFATQTLWTDERLGWAGVALSVLGAVLVVASILV